MFALLLAVVPLCVLLLGLIFWLAIGSGFAAAWSLKYPQAANSPGAVMAPKQALMPAEPAHDSVVFLSR